MNRAVYTATSGGLAAIARLDAVAQNLANVNTAGYKAERVLFTERPLDGTLGGAAPGGFDPILAGTAAQVVEVATVRDFSQGPIRPSGNPLDVAITGDGFFAVSTPRGERYTRQGAFGIDPEGYLVTAEGDRVQGDGGDLRLGAGDVAVGEDGTIAVDGAVVGRLKLVGFGDDPGLVAEGAALFAPVPGEAPAAIDAAAVRVQGGALEGANVDAVAGLIELVDVSRAFESYMRAVQQLDEVTQRSINEVGRVG
jgi:flagellar basal-body rod protein FlgG